jgi:predicted Rossmann-fold nucleotide-binding protein
MSEQNQNTPYSFARLNDFVEKIVSGQRPQIEYLRGGNDPYSCLIDQMATMFRAGHLVDYPGMYAVMENYGKVRLATGRGEEDFIQHIVPDTSRQAISAKGIAIVTDMHRWLRARGYDERVSVSGYSWDQRRPGSRAMAAEAEVRDAHVILPGGLYAMRGALELIRLAVEAPADQKPGPIYLVNPRVHKEKDYRFWDGLHDALEMVLGMPERQRAANGRDWSILTEKLAGFDIHVVDGATPDKAIAACKEKLTAQLGQPNALRPITNNDLPEIVPTRYQIPRGSTVFFATTSPDKLVELRKMLAPQDVRVARLDMLTPCNSPLEKSGTYTGNCGEKMREAIDAVRAMQQNQPLKFKRLLQEMQVSPEKAFVIVEDSGVHTSDRRVAAKFPLDGMEKGTTLHDGQFIGQEFGPATIGALGEKQFFSNLNRAFDAVEEDLRHQKAQYPDRRIEPLKRTMVQTSVFGLAPLSQPIQPKQYDFQIFSATSTMDVLKAPRPAEDKVIHAGHFLAPRRKGMAAKSQVEMDHDQDDYTLNYSARSKAVIGMVQACRIPAREFSKSQTAQDFAISLYGNLDSRVGSLLREKIGQLEVAGYRVEMPRTGQKTLADSIESTLQHSDATLLMPFPPEAHGKHFVENLYTLFSHIVARQIHPRDRDKPLVVFNPQEGEAKGCWDRMLAYFDELREIGMVKDQNRTLLQEVGTLDAARKLLDLSRQNLMRTPLEEESSIVLDEKDLKKSGKFNVAVFCSATNKNQHLLDLADMTGAALALQNYGIVYGAGDRSMMGKVLEGALNMSEAVKDKGHSLFLAGSSTDAILKAEATDAEGIKRSLNTHGQYFHAKDIYQRMTYMIKQSDAFLILPGGAGTIQELAALMMLKQGGHPDMKNKEIVVLDFPYRKAAAGDRTDDRGFFSGLLEQIPAKEREVLGIHVVKTQEEAMARLAQLRTEKSMEGWADRAAETRRQRDAHLPWTQAVSEGHGMPSNQGQIYR